MYSDLAPVAMIDSFLWRLPNSLWPRAGLWSVVNDDWSGSYLYSPDQDTATIYATVNVWSNFVVWTWPPKFNVNNTLEIYWNENEIPCASFFWLCTEAGILKPSWKPRSDEGKLYVLLFPSFWQVTVQHQCVNTSHTLFFITDACISYIH